MDFNLCAIWHVSIRSDLLSVGAILLLYMYDYPCVMPVFCMHDAVRDFQHAHVGCTRFTSRATCLSSTMSQQSTRLPVRMGSVIKTTSTLSYLSSSSRYAFSMNLPGETNMMPFPKSSIPLCMVRHRLDYKAGLGHRHPGPWFAVYK